MVEEIFHSIYGSRFGISRGAPGDARLILDGAIVGDHAVFNYTNYPGAESNTDSTTSLQNFLLWCQLQALSMETSTHDNLLQRMFVTAYIPRGKWVLTSPLIVPEFVNLKCDGEIIRSRNPNGNANLMYYDGDTTQNANYNLYFPAVISVPRSHIEALNILGNADGSNKGSGLFCGKNWTIASAAISSAGRGYSVSDVLTFAQPSKNYYVAAQVTVDSVDSRGAITGVTLSNAGAYALPEKLQRRQWTAANGFTGDIANGTPGRVFDAAGAFVTSGGTGSGATFLATWTPDWDGVNSLYNSGAFLVTDTLIGSVSMSGIGTSFSSTFGPMFGFWPTSGNYEINHVEVVGGNVGLYIRGASDIRANTLNAVDCSTNMAVFAIGSFECQNIVLDTCISQKFFSIDQCDGAMLKIHCLMPPATDGVLGTGFVGQIGSSSSGSGQTNANLDIEVNCTNCGTTSGAPMLQLAYTKGSRVKAFVSNYGLGGVANHNKINAVATFGTGWDTSNVIEGTADGITGSLFNGSIPGCGIRIWDDAAGGWCMNQSIYQIYGSGAPTDGTTGANKAAPNSEYIRTDAANRYINTNTLASPTWTDWTIP